MKGVILAGGKGTRLLPATRITNKHLIPIGSIPMIEFPLAVLSKLNVKEVLLVSGGEHVGDFAEYLGDGSDFGISFTYRIQKKPGGIAHALLQAESFFLGEEVLAILGDNIFETQAIPLSLGKPEHDRAHILLKEIDNPKRFGVARVGKEGELLEIIEKPENPPSNLIVTGVYRFPADVFDVVKTLVPSERGEIEITDVNNHYIRSGRMDYDIFSGFWSDAGTPESLFRANEWLVKSNNA